jgi:DNA-binding NarL/FixJ family response regulator
MFVTEDAVGVAAAQRMLAARGYDIVRANPADAADRCGDRGVDLLVTRSGGEHRQVIADVRRRSGRVPVLLLAADAATVEAGMPGVAGTIVGAVAPEQLVKAVRVTCPREPAGDSDRR